MPPHCDSLDGPVVRAATRALDAEDVDLVLSYVHAEGEDEVRVAFERAVKARALGPEAREVADLYFFETTVRVHRAGEGAPYTGLKPAGLDVGPVIPLAEAAIASGSVDRLARFLADSVEREARDRFAAMRSLEQSASASAAGLDDKRAAVEAELGLQVWAHKLYRSAHATAH